MKLATYSGLILLLTLTAHAGSTCPNLAGTYSCPKGPGQAVGNVIIKQETKSDGTTIYALDFGNMEDGGLRKEIADGKKRPLGVPGWEVYSYETRCQGNKIVEILSAPPIDPKFNGTSGQMVVTTYEAKSNGELKIDLKVNGKVRPTKTCAKALDSGSAKQSPAVTNNSGPKTVDPGTGAGATPSDSDTVAPAK